MRVFGKILIILSIVAIFGSNSFVLARCELKDNNGVVIKSRETNQKACKNAQEDQGDIPNDVKIRGEKEGTRVITCRDDGTFATGFFDVCTYEAAHPFSNFQLCVEETPTTAKCKTADTNCTSPINRKPDKDSCRNGSLWRCDGYIGEFYFLQGCEKKDGSNTECVETNDSAKCVKTQCVKDSKTREVDQSTCFGDYKIKCVQENGNDAKFEDNNPNNLCKFGCIERVKGKAECLSTFEEDNVCSEQDNNRLIQRTEGETACFSDGTLRQCGKKKKKVFDIIDDCPKKGQKCSNVTEQEGKCVDQSEPESPFDPPEITITGGGTNVFCAESGPSTDNPKIETALGCIPVRTEKFIEWLLPYVFGITGGISFLLMVYSFILMATSGGDPKKVQGAKETITSAIIGLLVSVFALFILRLITVNILKIPGIN